MSHIDAYTKGGKPVVAMRITVTGGHHPGCQAVTEKGFDSDGRTGKHIWRCRRKYHGPWWKTHMGRCQGDVDIQGGDNTLTKFRCLTTASVKE